MIEIPALEYHLVGFVNPLGIEPSFLEPLFSTRPFSNELNLQDLNDQDKIESFSPTSDQHTAEVDSSPIIKSIGDEALFAFAPWPNEKLIYGTRSAISRIIAPTVDRYLKLPMLTLHLVDFCSMPERFHGARLRAFSHIEALFDTRAALGWRDSQVIMPLIRSSLKSRSRLIGVESSVFNDIPQVRAISRTSGNIVIQMPRRLYDSLNIDATGDFVRDVHVDAAFRTFDIRSIEAVPTRKRQYATTSNRLKDQKQASYVQDVHESTIDDWLDQLSDLASLDESMITACLNWVGGHGEHNAASGILLKLLFVAGDRSDTIEAAMSWLDRYPRGDGAAEIVLELLSMATQRAEIVDRTVGWLGTVGRAGQRDNERVFFITRDRFEIIEEVIYQYLQSGGEARVDAILSRLLSLQSIWPNILRQVVDWAREWMKVTDVSRTMVKMITVARSHPDTIELALDWLSQFSNESRGQEIEAAICSAVHGSPQLALRVERWLHGHQSSAELTLLLQRLHELLKTTRV